MVMASATAPPSPGLLLLPVERRSNLGLRVGFDDERTHKRRPRRSSSPARTSSQGTPRDSPLRNRSRRRSISAAGASRS